MRNERKIDRFTTKTPQNLKQIASIKSSSKKTENAQNSSLSFSERYNEFV